MITSPMGFHDRARETRSADQAVGLQLWRFHPMSILLSLQDRHGTSGVSMASMPLEFCGVFQRNSCATQASGAAAHGG